MLILADHMEELVNGLQGPPGVPGRGRPGRPGPPGRIGHTGTCFNVCLIGMLVCSVEFVPSSASASDLWAS